MKKEKIGKERNIIFGEKNEKFLGDKNYFVIFNRKNEGH